MTDREVRQLEKLADEVRRRYADRRARMYPKYRMNREFAGHAIWGRAAELLLRRQASPEFLIESAFRIIRPFPAPHQILSARVIEDLDRNRGPSGMAVRFKYHMDLYLQLRGKPSLPDTLLSDEWLPFSPLFRFVTARAEGLEALASKYRSLAAEQLRRNPDMRPLIEEGSLQVLDGEEGACPR